MIRIGNAQGFWGDQPTAPQRLVRSLPDLDYLTLDYLAEVSLSIMAIQRQKDPEAGYARDFVDVVRSLIPLWKEGIRTKVVTNAGGLNPLACAEACRQILKEHSCARKIGIVYGDDVTRVLKDGGDFANLDTGGPLSTVRDRLVTANAYLGAGGIVKALAQGADIVITGRVADPSLTVAPCIHAFKWKASQFDELAGATIAGHLIECGTQATGGIANDWLTIENPANIGFPIVEIRSDGSCTLTKAPGTSGRVTKHTAVEQLLYEIGDPDCYISPDVTVSFTGLRLHDEGNDRVAIHGASGRAPTDYYKVSATYANGYRSEGSLIIIGKDARVKGQRCGQAIFDRLKQEGVTYRKTLVECLGSQTECYLHVAVMDDDKAAVEKFTREIAPQVTAGPPGTTGYISGRPPVRPVFGFWPCVILKEHVKEQVTILEDL